MIAFSSKHADESRIWPFWAPPPWAAGMSRPDRRALIDLEAMLVERAECEREAMMPSTDPDRAKWLRNHAKCLIRSIQHFRGNNIPYAPIPPGPWGALRLRSL